jgi:hypothetical protein
MAAPENSEHRVKRKYPIITAEQKEAIRQEVLTLLKAKPSLYLSDLKDHLVMTHGLAEQTAYMWLRHWSIG